MSVRTIEVKECDVCYQGVNGHYYIYKFETGEFDVCQECANKYLSPAIKWLSTTAGLDINARADSKVWG